MLIGTIFVKVGLSIKIMKEEILKKIELGNVAFKSWRTTPFEEKQELIRIAADLLEEKAAEFGKIITTEMGKPISQSIAEINKCALMMRYYADAENILKPEVIESSLTLSEVHYVPKGIILGVMPWNFPFWQVLRFATPALLAGNTVVIKHASICFGSGNAIEKVLLEAGFPKGVFQNLEIGHAEVEEILAHDAVQGVSLTGSDKAGAHVASLAGKNIKKSLLELGGSDAFIVLDDADLEKAVVKGVLGRLQNCGQTCVAAKRFIVHKNIEDSFLGLFKAEFSTYIPADPFDVNTKIAGMARADLADELEEQYQKAIENGAEVIIPLKRIGETTFQPGLIKMNSGNPLLQEEFFGPLGVLMIAENDDEALALANDIPFGLSNSVWTANKDRAHFFIQNLESGTVNVNRMTSSDPRFPFGGTKKSGYGTELSLHALKEFITIKTVVGHI